MVFTHATSRNLLVALALLGGATGAAAQGLTIDCAPPLGVSGSEAVAAIIADGARDCERAQAMMREGLEWRRRSESLRTDSERFRSEASALRRDAATYRRDVETYRRRLAALRTENGQLNAQRLRIDQELAQPRYADTLLRVSPADSALVVPTPGASVWEERVSQLRHARLRYIDVRLDAVDDEIMTLEGVIQVGVDVAADREASAVDFEQLAINNERAAIESDAAASLAEEAAAIGERSAILHHVHACTQFITLHMGDPEARRDVGRAIGYIDKYKSLHSNLDAAEAERLVSEARRIFSL